MARKNQRDGKITMDDGRNIDPFTPSASILFLEQEKKSHKKDKSITRKNVVFVSIFPRTYRVRV